MHYFEKLHKMLSKQRQIAGSYCVFSFEVVGCVSTLPLVHQPTCGRFRAANLALFMAILASLSSSYFDDIVTVLRWILDRL
jgi:hypothetical protein